MGRFGKAFKRFSTFIVAPQRGVLFLGKFYSLKEFISIFILTILNNLGHEFKLKQNHQRILHVFNFSKVLQLENFDIVRQ